jgi:ribose 5-phosphate isomerase B
MKIAVASDHRGIDMKIRIIDMIRSHGHEAQDFGPNSPESVDYPDYASKVSGAVSQQQIDRGILICGTGIGMCIVANKYDGVRAAPVHDELTAELSRRHNDANVLCLSADLIGEQALERIMSIWLKTEFEGGRHARRLEKVREIEASRHHS